MACLAASETAIYSASVELWAVTVCFLLFQQTGDLLIMKMNPVVKQFLTELVYAESVYATKPCLPFTPKTNL